MTKLDPRLALYQDLMEQRPDLFRPSPLCAILSDPEEMARFVRETGTPLGVLYQSPYSLLLADLVREGETTPPFAYERLVPACPGGVVIVPRLGERFVLLRQFRHAIRREQYAFPRGFGEPGLPARDNVAKELREELGASCSQVEYLGLITPDSGISAAQVPAYTCRVDRLDPAPGYEGIQDCVLLSRAELQQWIREGRVDDAFTLSAFALFLCR